MSQSLISAVFCLSLQVLRCFIKKKEKKSFICLDEGLTVRLKRSELIMIVSQLCLRYLMKKKILALKGHCSTPVLIHGCHGELD